MLRRKIFFFVFVFLFGCASERIFTYRDLAGVQEEIRIVYVKAVVDEEYRQMERNWKEKIPDSIQAASAQFEKQFKIRFVLTEIEEWNSESPNNNRALLFQEIKKKFPIVSDIDIIIAFTHQKSSYVWWLGTAEQLGNYVLIGIAGYPKKQTLVHEIGHIFGAIDYDGYHGSSYSVMNYDFWKTTEYFDKENAEKIMENKWRNFH